MAQLDRESSEARSGVSPGDGVSARTRERIIRAAERLFATRGIEAVSLREVNAAAGQRNKSAVHYHFGSKQALVEAIFEHRMAPLDAMRRERIEALDAARRRATLRDWVCVVVEPLAEHVAPEATSGAYVRFLAQLVRAPGRWLVPTTYGRFTGGVLAACDRIAGELGPIPEPLRRHRIASMVAHMVHALADREGGAQALGAPGEASLAHELFVADLVDVLVAGLRAPVSDAARALLAAAGGSP